jgi:plastocyanin
MSKRMVLIAAVVALAVAACSGDGAGSTTTGAPADTSSADAEAAVSIEGFAFGPAELTVAPGTTVTWTNDESGIPHTTTSDDGDWDSGTLQPGDTFSFTFDEPGTYAYSCSIHPSMHGTIVVEG